MKGKTNSPSCSSKFHVEDVGEDRISKLPDNLIHEILSSIDMRYVVQTSVLSKRWKNIWVSLPFIRLDWCHQYLHDYHIFGVVQPLRRVMVRFVNFVDKVFDSHDDSDIQMIYLGFIIPNNMDVLVEALNRWILRAVYHNVQNLTIDMAYLLNSAYEIPHQLLNSKSLKSLSIIHCRYTDIILPKSMSLPQIRTVCLEKISISNLELQRLFSSCPLLDTVTVRNYDMGMNNERNIIIDCHSLQTFALEYNHRAHLGSTNHFLTHTTKISAPNVKDFTCTGFMTEDFFLDNLSSLVRARLNMRLRKHESYEIAEIYYELPAEVKEMFAKRMVKYLGAVQKVQHLTLSSGFLEVLLEAPATIYLQPPQLCNLETLSLEMRMTRGCLRSTAYLLKISPILRTLKLKSKESNLADVGDDWEVEFSLTCMFSHLKFVEIREVEGCDNELKLMRFLLKNSTVLEEVNLFFRSTGDSLSNGRQVRRFKRNLRVLPKASSNIQMNFV